MIVKISFAFILFFSPFVFAKEYRCGWLENPSPANYWLTDKDGEWTISTQGGHNAIGIEKLTDFPERDFVKTNGGYGYGCACISSDVDNKNKKIINIYKFKILKLETCKLDESLNKKTDFLFNELNE